ncbi:MULTISPECIES: Cof-type HAD-IIB family hydrolase [Solibacillus]|uniref:Cof-type HAD-IIB family hydrolase n=1 Tax=Solibacillus merdavium TaxID=2762218 RepID=A0ABR8XI37_9BACL|nr:Cof-type HAD-IIB family hydrolase [Solibacillus merdavium]MBD8031594.1 Cof-type HAD-IIB family hydrolase [Solibacillus merdavium]
MKRLLFFDVDGTLYNSEKKLPNSAKEAILKAREKGHEIAIATGRAPFMIKDILEELQIDTYVTFNGQYVVYKGEVIYTNQIVNEMLATILKFGSQRNHPFVFLNEKEMIATEGDYESIEQSLATLYFPYPQIDANYYLHTPVYQTLIFINEQEQPIYEQQFPEVQFVRWHPLSCDMLPKGGSKANGIKKLLEYTGFSEEQIVTFGDGLNDIEMLSEFPQSVAMGNGHKKAKEAASMITAHVDEDGLALAMEKLKLV